MRTVVLIALAAGLLIPANAFLVAGADAKADAIKKEMEKLEGAWMIVSAEINGKKASDEQLKKDFDAPLVFKGDKASIRQKGETILEGTIKIDPTKKPKTLDLNVTKGQLEGKKSLAIYELDGDTFKACWTHFAMERERPSEFATKPDSGLLLLVYKRAKN